MILVGSGQATSAPLVAVVGGGVSGLAAAHFLCARTRAEVVVLEAGQRLGGKVLTQDVAGLPIEAGPDGFLADAGLLALCGELGLGGDLVEAVSTQAYFWEAGGGMRPLAAPDMRHTAVAGRAPTRFFALRGGLEGLIAALRRQTPRLEVRLGTAVRGLRAAGGRVALVLADHAGTTVDADAAILAVPAPQAARLLADLQAEAAAALAAIPYLDLGVVALLYPGSPWRLEGSGFLAAERPDRVLSGCTWLSAKWPHLAGGAHTAMRATVGGSGGTAWAAMDDATLVAAVHRDLVAALGPAPAPVATHVTRWRQGISDHRFRDGARVDRARAALAGSGVTLAAGGYVGGGMAACVAEAGRAADAVLASLAAGAPSAAP